MLVGAGAIAGAAVFGAGAVVFAIAAGGSITTIFSILGEIIDVFLTPFQRSARIEYRDVVREVTVEAPTAQPIMAGGEATAHDSFAETAQAAAQVLPEEMEAEPAMVRLRDVVDRIRQELPLLMEVSDVLAFPAGPTVAVVGIVEDAVPSRKGGMVAKVRDLSDAVVRVWLPESEKRFEYPQPGSLLLAQGRICSDRSQVHKWVKADTWGDPDTFQF